MTTFDGLNLNQSILRALTESGYAQPTPIQQQSIPALLEGQDLLGIAQTGTGKTASFALPLLDRLSRDNQPAKSRKPRALILAPTRELAGQIQDSIKSYGRHLHLRSTVVFGGVPIRNQIRQLDRGVHILVATPGRLVDLLNQGCVVLGGVDVFILDEADRMLDMGFQRDLDKITAKLRATRQTVLFSATMPASVAKLADNLLNDPVRIEVTPQATTVEKIDQQVLFVRKDKKRDLLSELLADKSKSRVLVFSRTKHGADRITRHLRDSGVSADAIHGNKAQNARQRALNGFKTGNTRVLVATDIAARGIDVDDITHVINFDLPVEVESYVHRIGRTARAGTTGAAISFCQPEEVGQLRLIEKVINQSVPVNEAHSFHVEANRQGSAGQKKPTTNKQRRHRRQKRRSGFKADLAA